MKVEESKKAIKNVIYNNNEKMNYIDLDNICGTNEIGDCDYFINAIETVLQTLEEKDKESHLIQSKLDIANAEIIEKDKTIDLMSEHISDIDAFQLFCNGDENCHEDCRECVKDYFRKKAKDE